MDNNLYGYGGQLMQGLGLLGEPGLSVSQLCPVCGQHLLACRCLQQARSGFQGQIQGPSLSDLAAKLAQAQGARPTSPAPSPAEPVKAGLPRRRSWVTRLLKWFRRRATRPLRMEEFFQP